MPRKRSIWRINRSPDRSASATVKKETPPALWARPQRDIHRGRARAKSAPSYIILMSRRIRLSGEHIDRPAQEVDGTKVGGVGSRSLDVGVAGRGIGRRRIGTRRGGWAGRLWRAVFQ